MEFQQKELYLTALKEMNCRKPVIPAHTPIRISSPARRMLQNARIALKHTGWNNPAPMTQLDSKVVPVPGHKQTHRMSPMKDLVSLLPVTTSTPNNAKALIKRDQPGFTTSEQSIIMDSEVYTPDVNTAATPLLKLTVQRRRSFNIVQGLLQRNEERENGSLRKSASGSNLVSSSASKSDQADVHENTDMNGSRNIHLGAELAGKQDNLHPDSPLGKLFLSSSSKPNHALISTQILPEKIPIQSPMVDLQEKKNAANCSSSALESFTTRANDIDMFEGFKPAVLSPLMPAVLLAGGKRAKFTEGGRQEKKVKQRKPITKPHIGKRISALTPRGFARRALTEYFV